MWERFAGADTTECFPPSQARGDRAAQLCEGHAMSDAILLQADGDSAEILPFGAELSAWRADGVDLVWAKDPKIWDQTAPVLFPVVGWTRDAQVTVAGRKYPLALHGFAWKKCFEIAEQQADYLRLLLLEDAETHALYPFAFRF